MELKMRTLVSLLTLFSLSFLHQTPAFAAKKSYIVYVDHDHLSPGANEEAVVDSHNEILGSILKDKEKAKASIFYYYSRHINGFAANLEEEVADKLSEHPSVLSVIPNIAYQLHTTRSWQFMGLEDLGGHVPDTSLWKQTNFGEDVIIAHLDSGVWPESASFSDEGYGPIPSRWKGICDPGVDKQFKCNRKLIGARFFDKGYNASGGSDQIPASPRDRIGHGTHTLSTAGGNFVANASLFGNAQGTAKGGAPRARVATYKVCWDFDGCNSADILAGFEMAMSDGVDVISVSLGGVPNNYAADPIAVGSFYAVKKGIPVICSAGNQGPGWFSVTNLAPWIFTVGASIMDREFPTYLTLKGTNLTIKGESLSANGLPENKYYPIINAYFAGDNDSNDTVGYCVSGLFDPEKVKGKIVACAMGLASNLDKGEAVREAGGVGMILMHEGLFIDNNDDIIADPHILPAIEIHHNDSDNILSYINSNKSLGYISTPTTRINVKPSPKLALFSSVGPNRLELGLLKPDIIAPGVDILAAFSEYIGPASEDFDTRRVPYNVISGTSMACPHVSGITGLLKAAHPTWTPPMIKSAIMTSATLHGNTGNLIKNSSYLDATPYDIGAGHVDPNKAVDPGLIYDLTTEDYLNFLCISPFNTVADLRVFSQKEYKCPDPPMLLQDFNYPSIIVPKIGKSMSINRTVTNVGPPSTYTATINGLKSLHVTVNPPVMKFSKTGEKQQYTVTFSPIKVGGGYGPANEELGRLVWSDGKRRVASPLLVNSYDLDTS